MLDCPYLVHRFLVKYRRILHRNISLNNIYITPKWKSPPDSMQLLSEKPRPKFINKLLDYSKPVHERCVMILHCLTLFRSSPSVPKPVSWSNVDSNVEILTSVAR